MEFLIRFINDLATDLFYEDYNVNGEVLFQSGGCFEFYKIIKHYAPSIELYVHKKIDHCVFLYNGILYDSTGALNDDFLYRKANSEDLAYIEEYFGKHISTSLSLAILNEMKLCNIEDRVYENLKEEKVK